MKNKILWAGRSASAGNKKTSNKKNLENRFVPLRLEPEDLEDVTRRERASRMEFDLAKVRVIGEAFVYEGGHYLQVIEQGRGFCSCPDFKFRRRAQQKLCKHLYAFSFALTKVNTDLIKGCKREVIITGSPMD